MSESDEIRKILAELKDKDEENLFLHKWLLETSPSSAQYYLDWFNQATITEPTDEYASPYQNTKYGPRPDLSLAAYICIRRGVPFVY